MLFIYFQQGLSRLKDGLLIAEMDLNLCRQAKDKWGFKVNIYIYIKYHCFSLILFIKFCCLTYQGPVSHKPILYSVGTAFLNSNLHLSITEILQLNKANITFKDYSIQKQLMFLKMHTCDLSPEEIKEVY